MHPLEAQNRLRKALPVRVQEVIGSSFAVKVSDAAKVYDLVFGAVTESQDVNLDWNGVEMISPAFLAVTTGLIHFDFDESRCTQIFLTNFISALGQETFDYMVTLDTSLKFLAGTLKLAGNVEDGVD